MPTAHDGGERQAARLALIRTGDRLAGQVENIITAWRMARLRPGAPLARCGCCGARFEPAEFVPVVALLVSVLSSTTVEIAGLCASCAGLGDELLIAELLARRGGQIDAASVSSTVGTA